MPDRSTPVDGPFRISVTAIPAGAELDVSHYLNALVLQLAHIADEDGESLLDELRHINSLAHAGPDSPALHERDTAVEALIEELVAGGGIPVYGQQVLRLAEALTRTVVPKAVPQQRGAA